jgi:two-component system nitrogen regulation response regulator GlnG
MPIQLQSKILRVLQDGEFSRVGGNDTLKTDVRIVAATNKNLEQEVAKKTFREDLFYRLNVVRIQLPPLRQRTEDIRLLAEYFPAKGRAAKASAAAADFRRSAPHSGELLLAGNVRELENTIQRACVLATSDLLLPKDIPARAPRERRPSSASAGTAPGRSRADDDRRRDRAVAQSRADDPDVQLLPWLEREFHALRDEGDEGQSGPRAKLLGITRATLRKRIERFGITRELTIT